MSYVSCSEMRSFLYDWLHGVTNNVQHLLKVYGHDGGLCARLKEVIAQLRDVHTPDEIECIVEKTFELAYEGHDGSISWEAWVTFNKKEGMAKAFGKLHQVMFQEEK